jgi:hypothetical protein
LSPSRCPCGALLFMYFILRFRNSWTDSWFGCNKIIHLQFMLLLFVICVVISWWFCCIYMRDLILAHIWLLDLCSL